MAKNSSTRTARLFLSMLDEDHKKLSRAEEYLVPLAADRGVPPAEIAALSGTPLDRVMQILSEA